MNLLKLVGSEISETSGTRKLTIKGETKNHKVYKVPLYLLFYNDQNGRIATWISKYKTDGGTLSPEKDKEAYNKILHDFIAKSNPDALKKTKNNIRSFGQRVAGVVLQDGRIIDGNRRFTCLRELNAEEGLDCYFEAVILDKGDGLTDKDIKRLELNLQHAEEKPVDYNPIDNLVDVYRDLIENRTFTDIEYKNYTSKTANEVKKLKEKAILMVEFLQFINAEGKYYIAREMNLDGPLQEIWLILKKIPDGPEKDAVKDTLFTNLLTSNKGDLTRYIRDIGKHIIKTENVNKYIEDHEEIVEEIYDKLQEEKQDTVKQLSAAIQEEKKVVKKSQQRVEKFIEKEKINNARNRPVDLMNKAIEQLYGIEIDTISRLSPELKEEFSKLLKEAKDLLVEWEREL